MSDDAAWMVLKFDEKNARRSGMPMEVPLRKKDMDLVADGGLSAALARKSITAFLQEAPSSWRAQNASLASRYDSYVGKAMYSDRAEAAVAKGDLDATIAALGMVARLDKEDHGARLNLGVAYSRKGDFASARRELDAIEATFDGDADYHCMRGQVLLALDDADGGLEQFVLALEANPSSKQALDALVKCGVLVAIYEDPRDPASLAYLRSDAIAEHLSGLWAELGDRANLLDQLAYHESEGRHDVVAAAAEALLARADASDAHRERAETSRIHAIRELGRHDEAMALARSLVAARPGSASAHVELARCLAHAGDPEAARAELDRALELDPGDALALRLRFWPREPEDLVAVKAAIPKLEEFARQHPLAAGAQRSLARAKLVAGAADDGIALFEKAVALEPDNDELRAELWTELMKLGREAEVVADAGRIEGLARRNWTLRWGEAEAYGRLKRKTEASAGFLAIAADDTLNASIRKRARRAAARVSE